MIKNLQLEEVRQGGEEGCRDEKSGLQKIHIQRGNEKNKVERRKERTGGRIKMMVFSVLPKSDTCLTLPLN